MDYLLPNGLVGHLPQMALDLLDGGRRYVHSESTGITWRFGTLSQLESGWVVGFNDAQHLPKTPPFVPMAISDDGDALVCLNADLDCSFWYHDEEAVSSDRFKLTDWLDEAKRVDSGALSDESRPTTMPSALVGTWIPARVLTPDSAGVLELLPSVEFTIDCRWIEHSRTGGLVREFPIESLGPDPVSITIMRSGELMTWTVEFKSDDQIVMIGPQPDFKVLYDRKPEG